MRAPEGDGVELLNRGPSEVDLTGYTVTDEPETGVGKAAVPAGTRVPPGGYLFLSISPEIMGFGLGADEAFGLFTPAGELVDWTDWAEGDAPSGGAWGRLPDGTGAFRALTTATPGATNDGAAEPAEPVDPAEIGPPDAAPDAVPPTPDAGVVHSDVVVDEVMFAGPEADWVELTNTGREPYALDGHFLTDDPEGRPLAWAIPVGTAVPPGGHLAFEVSADATGFGLGSDESVALVDPTGRIVARADWAAGDAGPAMSWGRLPDGTGPFRALARPTRGAENTEAPPSVCGDAACDAGESAAFCPFDCAPETGLVINEIVAAGDPDAVELYNGNRTDAELDGWFVSDEPAGDAERGVLPEGTVVPARGYLVLTVDDTTVGFRLSSAESFSLTAPDGVLIDVTTWQAGDAPMGGAWARRPNGVGAFHAAGTTTLGERNAD